MNEYERELMKQGVYLIRAPHIPEIKLEPYIPEPNIPEPKRKVSPYAKFDKFHHKKKRR